MDQLQSLMNNWILLAQGLIGSIGALALATGALPHPQRTEWVRSSAALVADRHDVIAVRVILPDGTFVLALGRLGLVPADRRRQPDYALYLDRRWRADPGVTWPCVFVEWEDFGAPVDEQALFASVTDVYRRARSGGLIEVGCYGGLGRTGTVLACLATLAGLTATEAVLWVRAHYHAAAIETTAQEELVARFAETLAGTRDGAAERDQ